MAKCNLNGIGGERVNPLVPDKSVDSGLRNLPQETRNINLSCGAQHYVDISNGLGVDHQCDRRTDRQTDRITTIKTALVYARAVKTVG